jgi:hypothetical protein
MTGENKVIDPRNKKDQSEHHPLNNSDNFKGRSRRRPRLPENLILPLLF